MRFRSWDDFSVVALACDDSLMLVKTNSTKRIFSPAKVNLLLAVTGKRSDGFHDLVSLVAPLDFGDSLELTCLDGLEAVELTCTDPHVPLGRENLVVQAVERYSEAVGWKAGVRIHLEKNIPMEAGLGGGSSNAAATLLALNELNEEPLGMEALSGLAAELGSDCPLFLEQAPVIMRGRGEKIERLSNEEIETLAGQRLVVFKPSIGISTPWAYGALAEDSCSYAEASVVEGRLQEWKNGGIGLSELLYNSFEGPVFTKFVVFPTLFTRIQNELGLRPLMSGSGSSCLVLVPDEGVVGALQTVVKEALGESVFFEVTAIRSET